MAKHRIRITGAGIYGAPTADNPTGEIAIGTEFDTDADLPAGWKGRAVIVGEEASKDAEFVVAEDDGTDEGRLRNQIGKQAQAVIERATRDMQVSVAALTSRAERAEADLQAANEQIEALNEKLKASEAGPGDADEPSGDAEPASADEIKSALGLLDGANDGHWTDAGLPRVEAIADLTGKAVTRKAITEAAPDAKRPA